MAVDANTQYLGGLLVALHNDLYALGGRIIAGGDVNTKAVCAKLDAVAAAFAAGASPAPVPTPPPATPFSFNGKSYATLTAALADCTGGGTITVADGTWPLAVCGAHIGAANGNVVLQAANKGKAIFDGQQMNAAGSNGHPRAIWGKAITHVSDAITVTISGIAYVNGADPTDTNTLAAIYGEGGCSLVVNDCSFDGCGDGVFGNGTMSYIANRCVWGRTASNGVNQPGYSHDVYLNSGAAVENDCLHLGNRDGHSFKCRGPDTTLNRGYYSSVGGGRALDFPNGGKVRVNGADIAAVPGDDANLLGLGDENTNNGAIDFQMTGGVLVCARNPNTIYMPNGGTATFSGVQSVFLNGGQLQVSGSGTVTGLPLVAGPGTLSAAPLIPAG